MARPDENKESSTHEIAHDKSKETREGGASERKEGGKHGGAEALIHQVMEGAITLEAAVLANPSVIFILQARFGNKVVEELAAKKAGGGADKKDDAKDAKGAAGKDGAAKGHAHDKGADKKGDHIKGAIGGLVAGAGIGGLIGKAKKLGGKEDDAKHDKAAADKGDGKKVDNAKDAAKESKDEGKAVKKVDTTTKDAGKSETKADKDEKEVGKVAKGQDPGKKVDEAIKKKQDDSKAGTDDKASSADKKVDVKDDKADKKPGDDPKKAQADQKADSDLKKTTDAKDSAKTDDQKKDTAGGSKGKADQVLDKAKDVAHKKDDSKDAAKGLDAGKEKKEPGKEGGKHEAKHEAKHAGGKHGHDEHKGKKADGKDAKDAKAGSGGKDPAADKAGPSKDGKKDGADGKDAKDEKGGEGKEDDKTSKDNPTAKDAQKAKDDADKGGDGGGASDKGGDDKGGAAADKDEKGGGGGAADKEGKDAGGGGGGGSETQAGPGGAGPGPAAKGPVVKEKSLAEYIKAHPDTAAADRVQSLKFQNDKVGRDANELKANVEPAPDKSFLDAVSPRQEWFQLKKAVAGPNKWTGQDKALDFMTRLNGALDSIGGAAGKIGLACTIGGAILTFLVPPVGAFLLAVGRIANAIQLACSALRIVTSIVTTIMLAVKAAKEKDPIKRLEMMQEMKANVQAGVMAGIDVIMSKIGGKAKGAAGASGGKAFGAAKAAWKEGMKAGGLKGVVKGAAGFVKEGTKAFMGGMKQSFKDGVAGMKGQLAMAKQLGVGGTIKAIGKSAYSGIKSTLAETFVKPVTEIREGLKSCMNFRQNWRDFRGMISANGGGFSGYRSTLGQLNFPNYSGGNWKEKAKSVFKDMTDTSAGGYASQVAAGIKGTEAKNTYKKNADGTDMMSADGKTKVLDTSDMSKNKSGGQVLAQSQRDKLAKLEKALKGSDVEKRQVLNDGKRTDGALADELNEQGTAGNDLSKRHSAYKNSIGTQDGGTAYSVGGTSESNLDFRLKQEIEKTKTSFNVLKPKSMGTAAWDMANIANSARKGEATGGDVAETAIGHMGAVGSTSTKFMIGTKSQQDRNKGKKSLFEEAAEKNEARTKAAVGQVPGMLKDGSWAGMTANKVNAATSPAMKIVADRERALGESMQQSGPKTAAAPTAPTVAKDTGGGAKSEPPPPPPPPAPPEGTVIPDPSLTEQISAQKSQNAATRKSVQADVAASEKIKASAIGADQTMAKYAQGLDAQAGELGKEKSEAAKDVSEVAASKDKIAKGGADMSANKAKAEGEKSKTAAEEAKGKSVQNPQVDEAKKKAEENRKSAEEKAKWDAEYRDAGFFHRRWMDAKKLIGGVFSWIAKAAQWVWNNIIKVAIEAVKKAIAKVIGFITDLMMAGILKLVKCFLSEEEGARLDQTMAQMKELEAKQAQKATEETESTNKSAKMKLTGAQQAAKAKIDHADGNIKTGKDLIGQLDANDQVLDKEASDVKSKNEAFKAQYTPYFAWQAEQEKKGGADQKADKGGDQKDPKGAGKTDGKDSGAADKGGELKAAPVTKDEPKKEHPADQKLDSQVSAALAMAVQVLIADSKQSTADVAKASGLQSGKVSKVADNIVQANIADLKAAAAKTIAAGQKGDPSSYIQDESMRGQAMKTTAGSVHAKLVAAHAAAEAERQGRLQQLMGVAQGLSGQSLKSALGTADQLAKQLSKEAAAIDAARSAAIDEMSQGYQKAAGG